MNILEYENTLRMIQITNDAYMDSKQVKNYCFERYVHLELIKLANEQDPNTIMETLFRFVEKGLIHSSNFSPDIEKSFSVTFADMTLRTYHCTY